jgi:DNA-binding beta-propeller fold protein YncE
MKILRFPWMFAAFTVAGAQTLLVVNQHDHTITMADPASGKQIATVTETVPGQWGHEIVASTDGRTAYLPVYGDAGVGRPGVDGSKMLVIDLASHRVTREVDFGHGVRPHLPVLDRSRDLLYVTTELDDAVTIIDPRTLAIIGKVPTGQAQSHMLTLSRDGRFGYTANVGPGTVSVLDMLNRKTLAVIPVSPKVQRISITPDGRMVFTSDQTQPRLAVIDTATRKVKSWVPLSGLGYGAAPTPDGRWLLVAIPSKNLVDVVDLQKMRVSRTVTVADDPQEVLIAPDGKTAYVSCAASAKVAAISLDDWKLKQLIAAGHFDDGLGWAP